MVVKVNFTQVGVLISYSPKRKTPFAAKGFFGVISAGGRAHARARAVRARPCASSAMSLSFLGKKVGSHPCGGRIAHLLPPRSPTRATKSAWRAPYSCLTPHPATPRAQSFHPSNPKNLKKLFESEEKARNELQKREELAKEHAMEETRRHAKSLMAARSGEKRAVEPPPSMGFMYQKPPGMAQAQAKAEKAQRPAERDAERFPLLKDAPRQGEYSLDIEVRPPPLNSPPASAGRGSLALSRLPGACAPERLAG